MLPDGFETPAYVYELDEVRASYRALRAALPEPSSLHYSLKANPHPEILRTLVASGAHAEVCSPGELAAALDAGWAPEKVLYSGPGKRVADLEAAITAGVRDFSVDSPHALDQLDEAAGRLGVTAGCLLRVNDDLPVLGQALVMTGVASPFGADVGWIEAEPASFASRKHAEVVGLHLYMGSNVDGTTALLAQFRQTLETAARLRRVFGEPFRVLNLGGGFGAPFARAGRLPSLASLHGPLTALLDSLAAGWRDAAPAITFESGRHLTATCGTLYTRVLDVKRSHGKRIVILESGVNHLGGMSGLRRLPPVFPEISVPGQAAGSPSGEVTPAVLTGPLCTPLDVWARGVELPEVAPGDVLMVGNVGAYGLQASLVAFLGHPLPLEVVLDRGVLRCASRQSLQRLAVACC